MLELYRRALAIRRREPALGDGTLRWLDAPDDALAFARDPRFVCIVNFGSDPVPAPPGADLLLSSGDLGPGGEIPADTAAWFTTPASA